VKTLSVCPSKVEQHEGGHDGERDGHATMPVARTLSKKSRITSTASAPPWTASCSSALIAARM
jgi:hypothetical protein